MLLLPESFPCPGSTLQAPDKSSIPSDPKDVQGCDEICIGSQMFVLVEIGVKLK